MFHFSWKVQKRQLPKFPDLFQNLISNLCTLEILGNWKLNAKMDWGFHFVYELSLSSTVEAKELSSVAVSQKCSRIAFVQ